ncbi:hypothetical protein MSG28_002512 [Choristoneura fumiferana]|uniref:Uncharacterized protein n=2 Tax=Choristoneura fumiferana TaxID=7141 RepID=A0ACC0JWM8_CHOFU|nr:hypothetical protein MSG28_002511 [Choristoneura fumiferana]KAI8428318.1 hypothetical protein MSG28_002512 [Choristoneura fumiferana]
MFSFKFLLFTSFGSMVLEETLAVPPDACFANFRWDDCGLPAKPVMYYWKPGSRCEVGLWKGCLPNQNMFEDEYECVRTCIFADRAGPEDYHEIHKVDTTTEEVTTGETEETTADETGGTGDTGSTGTGVTGTGGNNTGTGATEGGNTGETKDNTGGSGGTPGTGETGGNSGGSDTPAGGETTAAPA